MVKKQALLLSRWFPFSPGYGLVSWGAHPYIAPVLDASSSTWNIIKPNSDRSDLVKKASCLRVLHMGWRPFISWLSTDPVSYYPCMVYLPTCTKSKYTIHGCYGCSMLPSFRWKNTLSTLSVSQSLNMPCTTGHTFMAQESPPVKLRFLNHHNTVIPGIDYHHITMSWFTMVHLHFYMII